MEVPTFKAANWESLHERADEIENQWAQCGHGLRVASYTLQLARKLGIAARDFTILRYAATFHDLGMVSIPEMGVQKRLSQELCSKITKHPLIELDIEDANETVCEVRQIIRAHHERWDGRGYPIGYSGTNIPLLARIIAVA